MIRDHLRRVHAAIYCDRCYTQFRSEDEQAEHNECEPCERPLEGLDKKELDMLDIRLRREIETNWTRLWAITWPTAAEEIPSSGTNPTSHRCH
jgi:hypothetical protein